MGSPGSATSPPGSSTRPSGSPTSPPESAPQSALRRLLPVPAIAVGVLALGGGLVAVSYAGPTAPHLAEMLPPVIALIAYVLLYSKRAVTLATQRRPVERWRIGCFVGGVVLMSVVQVGPFDALADELLVYHMTQHIIIGEVASFFVVVGLTGPLLQPLLSMRISRILRPAINPAVALVLWAADLYLWHTPFFYQLAIRHDLIHALEHACFFWFGLCFWLGLIGPLPKPRWFGNWARLWYVIGARLAGSGIANALIWIPVVFYPYYRAADLRNGLTPLEDQKLAGGVMMLEQILLGVALLTWLMLRAFRQDDERQALLDLAEDHGLEITDARAARAVASGEVATTRLRRLIESAPVESSAD